MAGQTFVSWGSSKESPMAVNPLSRREFIGSITLPAGFLAASALPALASAAPRPRPELLGELASFPGSPEEVAENEDFWGPIQRAFTIDRTCVNFNNGGVSPSPAMVQ